MSNHLAIATVTAALAHILNEALQAEGSPPDWSDLRTVSTGRPDAPQPPPPRINVFLYDVAPNAAWRNMDLPTRNDGGQAVQRPVAALDLHYLITVYGKEPDFEPERLLGIVARTLHERSVLTRDTLVAAITEYPNLKLSNLGDGPELVKITPLPMSVEELSKLWSMFYQIPYRLSVAYLATVVLLDGRTTPRTALPVRSRFVAGVPFQAPVIDEVLAAVDADAVPVAGDPILLSRWLVLRGHDLKSDVTQVLVDGLEVPEKAVAVSDREIRFSVASIPDDARRAGVRGVQVVHLIRMGATPELRQASASNVAPFVLRPAIASVSHVHKGDATLNVQPTVKKGQRLAFFMNLRDQPSGAAHAFFPNPPAADTDSLTIAFPGVAAGTYLARLQVDGAESPLIPDPDPGSPTYNTYQEPHVDVP